MPIEERSSLKRQVKELERALKKSTARLERERKEHEVYKQEVIERTYETEESRKKWQAEVEKQLNRVKAEAQKKLSTALSSSNAEMEKEKSDLALLQEQARKKAAEEKGKRVELLRRQIVRRIMHRDISRGWTAWHTKWAEKVRRKRMLARVELALQLALRLGALQLGGEGLPEAVGLDELRVAHPARRARGGAGREGEGARRGALARAGGEREEAAAGAGRVQ